MAEEMGWSVRLGDDGYIWYSKDRKTWFRWEQVEGEAARKVWEQ